MMTLGGVEAVPGPVIYPGQITTQGLMLYVKISKHARLISMQIDFPL